MADVFISYSSRNRLVADALKHNLEASGIRCWKAPDSILPGQVWEEAIISAIKNCRIVLLIWSTLSQESEQVQRELSVAVKSGKAVIPYRIEDVQPEGLFEYYLTNTHWLDAYSKDIDCAIQEVVKRIEALLETLAHREENAIERHPEYEFDPESRDSYSAKSDGEKITSDGEKTTRDMTSNSGVITRIFRRIAISGTPSPGPSESNRPSLLSRLKTISPPSRRTGRNAVEATSMTRIKLNDREERPICRAKNKPVILVDLAMPAKLGIPPSEITLFAGTTLDAIEGSEESIRQIYNQRFDIITPNDIFIEELYLLPGEAALTNTWLLGRLNGQPVINGSPVTPILPLRERTRDLFSSRELEKACSLRVISTGESVEVELTLMLQLCGQQQAYPLTRRFPVKAENLIDDDLPVITIWPNVSDERWKQFYIFSEDTKTGLTVEGYEEYELKTAKEGNQSVNYFLSERFPDLVKLTKGGRECGLIPVTMPAEAPSTVTNWSIGLDFGTSFTNFFINDGSGARRRPLRSMLLPLTVAQKEYQLNLLTRFFIPEDILPKGENPPTLTALNTYGWQEVTSVAPEIYHQARIPFPGSNSLALRGNAIYTGLKWKEIWYQKPFLKEMALIISSNAAAAGATQVNWSVSYPSAFAPNAAENYRKCWAELCFELNALTGIDHQFIENIDQTGFQTEAFAFAKYFGNYLDQPMVHTACLDVGGYTTDISIWQDNTLLHQVSIPFAGRDICTRVMQLRPSFIRFLFTSWHARDIGDDEVKLRQDPNFDCWFDNCLRYESDAILKYRIPILRAQQEKQMIEFVSLMAVSFAGIYHYLGLMLRGLHKEGSLRRQLAMPVCMGGNGARFMNWLDESGSFSNGSDSDELMEVIQVMSAGFTQSNSSNANTMLSNAFKDETAWGLISKGVNLKRTLDPRKDRIFAGESLTMNGKTYGPLERITEPEEGTVWSYELAGTDELKRFVENYDEAIEKLQLTSLLPIGKLNNPTKLWPEIETEIQKLCLERVDKKLNELEPEPPFITGLKALSRVLSRKWAERYQ